MSLKFQPSGKGKWPRIYDLSNFVERESPRFNHVLAKDEVKKYPIPAHAYAIPTFFCYVKKSGNLHHQRQTLLRKLTVCHIVHAYIYIYNIVIVCGYFFRNLLS